MFFNLIRRNSRRSRKENGIYFCSLIISIVSFYIILSLENQDIMVFLKTMESQAVDKLMTLIPVFYGFSLFILFFLVYFADKYQINNRSHELGIYQIMGMNRKRLFLMLFLEDMWSSLWSLVVGIPLAIFIAEIISLITDRIVGLGIIGHEFNISLKAIGLTCIGYMVIKLLALAVLTFKVARKDINSLLLGDKEDKHKIFNKSFALVSLILGIILLFSAYFMAIAGDAWIRLENMALTMVLGVSGTFAIFYGFAAIFEVLVKSKGKGKLKIFNFRQLQENIFKQPNTLAISSLLILIALCCFGFGSSMGLSNGKIDKHTIDYTFTEYNDKDIKKKIVSEKLKPYIDEVFNVRVAMLSTVDGLGVKKHNFSMSTFGSNIESQKPSREKMMMLNYFVDMSSPYFISLSGYNKILTLAGKEPIILKDNETALYVDSDFFDYTSSSILNKSMLQNSSVEIDGESYKLKDEIYHDNLVVDSSITLSKAFIISDDVFDKIIEANRIDNFWNATIRSEIIKEHGLMKAIVEVNKILDREGLEYESYLQNIGRQMFYRVASSYITIYLALIFLIVANTVIGVQFLMQQKKAEKRYNTLINLGCDYDILKTSARIQIRWYFGLPIAVAIISSIFGVRSLFTGLLSYTMKNSVKSLLIVALIMIVMLSMIEYLYMKMVMRASDRHILEFMKVGREE